MRVIASWCCALLLVLSAVPAMAAGNGTGGGDSSSSSANTAASAAATPANSPVPAASAAQPASSAMESELQQMRELLEAQAKQLQEQQQKMDLLEKELEKSNAGHDSATATPAADSAAAATPVSPSAAVAPATAAVSSSAVTADSQEGKNPPQPLSINIKGISLTPGGFMAAETVWRQKALASDVNTPFNSVPFNGSSNASMGEFQASGRQSRISMLVEGKLSSVKIGGYYEADFLSAGTTSNNNESNSYTFRQRQFWGQSAFNNGFTVTGGQMWSLITETTHGMDNRTEATPLTIDAQYNVGFSWARQYGLRFTKNFGNKFWLGMSVEEAQATLTVHGNPTVTSGGTVVCVTAACTGTAGTTTVNPTTLNNFLLGAFGTSGGLYNPLANYQYNPSPDIIVKAVAEPGFGHYEVFGLFSEFRDRVFPCVPITGTTAPAGCPSATSAVGANNDTRPGGGVGANARWSFFAKHVDLGFHFFGGDGIGRYGSSGLSDLTVRPDGTLVPIHNFQSLGTLILHPTSKLDVYMYVGGEYEARSQYIKSGATPNEGYGYVGENNSGCWTETLPVTGPSTSTNLGVPTGVGGSTGFIPGPLSNCTGDTRNLIEGTLGFWYRFYKGDRGTVQYGMQYSNWVRNTWRGVGGAAGTISASGQPHADDNMVFTSLRYYLP
jgi:hypothetical protein